MRKIIVAIVVLLIGWAINCLMAWFVYGYARDGHWDKAAGLAMFYLLFELDAIRRKLPDR